MYGVYHVRLDCFGLGGIASLLLLLLLLLPPSVAVVVGAVIAHSRTLAVCWLSFEKPLGSLVEHLTAKGDQVPLVVFFFVCMVASDRTDVQFSSSQPTHQCQTVVQSIV